MGDFVLHLCILVRLAGALDRFIVVQRGVLDANAFILSHEGGGHMLRSVL